MNKRKFRVKQAMDRWNNVEYYYLEAYYWWLAGRQAIKIKDSYGDYEKVRFNSIEEAVEYAKNPELWSSGDDIVKVFETNEN